MSSIIHDIKTHPNIVPELLSHKCFYFVSIVGFRSAITKFGVERYKKNCGPATEGFRLAVEERSRRAGPAPARCSPVLLLLV